MLICAEGCYSPPADVNWTSDHSVCGPPFQNISYH